MIRILTLALGLCLATNTLAQTQTVGTDYDAWNTLASTIEDTLETTDPSETYLVRQRENIAAQREVFSQAQGTNSTRLTTLREQIDALGPVPADGETEPSEITARRAELQAQYDAFAAPRLRATEAFTRADGIIQEIDRRLDAQQTDRLLALGPSPLDPRNWPLAVTAVTTSLGAAWSGVTFALGQPDQLQLVRDQLPLILLLIVVGALLILQARKRMEQATRWIEVRETDASHGFTAFIVSLGQVVLPLIGIVLLLQAANLSGLYGPRLAALLVSLPMVGFIILAAAWVGNRVFNRDDPASATIQLNDRDMAAGRRMAKLLGVVLGVFSIFRVFASVDRYSEEVVAVGVFLAVICAGLILLRLAQLLNRSHKTGVSNDADFVANGATGFGLKKRLSQLSVVVVVLSVGASAIGYTAAAEALIFPFILTLAILGVLAVLFEAVRDFFAWVSSDGEAAREGLAPVLVNAVLFLISIPVLLLVWGMRVSDLSEYWQTFRTGFRVGDTQFSPGVFVALIVVFSIGYFLTRLAQRTLRNTILPKTKIDIGGQTAMVSGFGYVGIFVSALVAISGAGLDLSSLAIVAGALSVGIGFGLQNIVSNFVSGIILLIERPIGEGDWIEVGGNMGIVKDISVRSTRIETFDRTDVIVPNADLVSGTVTNFTRGNTVGRIVVPAGAGYGSDTRKVERILREIAEGHPLISLNPAPSVVFIGFGADSLDFEIRAILRDISNGVGVKTELNHQIYERFNEEGIEIPFMQRDIWIKNPEALIPSEKDN